MKKKLNYEIWSKKGRNPQCCYGYSVTVEQIKVSINMKNKAKNSNGGNWIGVGTAIGAAVFAATNEPVWIAVGVAIGAALGWRKPKNKNEKEAS